MSVQRKRTKDASGYRQFLFKTVIYSLSPTYLSLHDYYPNIKLTRFARARQNIIMLACAGTPISSSMHNNLVSYILHRWKERCFLPLPLKMLLHMSTSILQ